MRARAEDLAAFPMADLRPILGIMRVSGDGSRKGRAAANVEEQLRLQKTVLGERVKELQCLFTILRIYNAPGLSLRRTMGKLVDAIRAAWQFPDRTAVRIVIRGETATTRGFRESPWKLRCLLSVRGRRAGHVEVCYLGAKVDSARSPFLPTERRLLRAVAQLTENMLRRKDAEREMERTALRLQNQKRQLERKNIALKEVLATIEMEKRETRERISAEIGSTILPVLNALSKPGVPSDQRQRYAQIIERALAGIGSSSVRASLSGRARLSPREAEIADLVRGGATSKEIGRLLHVSETTVERHRHNIRRKVGIRGQKANLVTYLTERL